jgi:hypothetical protein
LLILVALAAFVGAPLYRRPDAVDDARPGDDPELADLEARKEALYRQIRDAELDREQGKLTAPDWERVDGELRREAIAVLKLIDAARLRGAAEPAAQPDPTTGPSAGSKDVL